MCRIIVKETIRKANITYAKWNKEHAIIITAGVRYANYEHRKKLWASHSYPLYRAVMSLTRF
ncbi:hypothetical protein A3Q56_05517 [Intoshia linei]|uniref:Uncharacterized protein n=1 Tax=Intoshia linei TaxID=1819745 RepID=A0A177AXP8_9BILA|nr:hypothetical protein A3Q56_05517 [Intoshia linei]